MENDTLFRTLDDVPWADLVHAYGSAADIPDHFRQLLSPDSRLRANVFDSFYGNIFHSGTVYPATAAAVPFLVEAVGHPRMPDRDQILILLAHIAVGFPEDLVVKGFDVREMLALADPLRPRDHAGKDDESHGDWSHAETWRQCYAEVGAGCPVYSDLLEDQDATVRIAASFLLAWFPAHGWSTAAQLLELARDDVEHDRVRCGCLLALSHMAGRQSRPVFLQLAETIIADATRTHTPGTPYSWLEATACFCLLREHYLTRNRAVPAALGELAEACLRDGVAFPGAVEVRPHNAGFPWGDVPRHLGTVIRKLMKKPKRRRTEDDDE